MTKLQPSAHTVGTFSSTVPWLRGHPVQFAVEADSHSVLSKVQLLDRCIDGTLVGHDAVCSRHRQHSNLLRLCANLHVRPLKTWTTVPSALRCCVCFQGLSQELRDYDSECGNVHSQQLCSFVVHFKRAIYGQRQVAHVCGRGWFFLRGRPCRLVRCRLTAQLGRTSVCCCCSLGHAELQHCSAELSFSFFLREILLINGTDNMNLTPEQDEGRLQTGVATRLSCFLLRQYSRCCFLSLWETPCCE